MKILVINAGSSSLKYQLIDMDGENVLAKGICERIGAGGHMHGNTADGRKFDFDVEMPNHTVAFQQVKAVLTEGDCAVIASLDEIRAVGHRVVQGGATFNKSMLVDDTVIAGIKRLCDLAPLHNAAHLQGIHACQEVFGQNVPQVVVFDNAFHSTMPPEAYLYAIPYEYYEKYKIRRYGFHGTSHMFVSGEAIKFGGLDPKNAKVIVCHLGNGASVSASIGGKCVDTSMGLTPLEGLIMGTRSGDIDPAVVQFICNKEGKDVNEVLNILNKKSGVLGMSGGISSDFRDIEAAKAEGNHLAEVALDAFVYRVAKYIGAYTAAMNGVDAIAFTAGVGENDKVSRKAICEYLGYLGVKIDDQANDVRGKNAVISAADSKVKVMLIPTNEELAIARETKRLVEA